MIVSDKNSQGGISMKNAATYFNKVLNLTAGTRSEKDVCFMKNTSGLLLEISEDNIRYQYLLPHMPVATKNVSIPFISVYEQKKMQSYSMNDESVILQTESGDVAVPMTLLTNETETFGAIAQVNLDMFADALYGCGSFAKKGRHTYNQKTFLRLGENAITVFSGTDIAIIRNRCEAKVAGEICFGVDNTIIPKIKKWMTYANNPKNGTGDVLWVALKNGFMRLVTQTCAIVFPVSALPEYKQITRKFDDILDYPYPATECDLDWDELLKAIKSKDEFIDVDGDETLRTFSADFITHASLKEYEVFRLNTQAKALLFKQEDSSVIFMLKTKDVENDEEEES
jgi:hypothetical protein